MASDEPVVAVPIACFDEGAFQRAARIEIPERDEKELMR